MRSTDEKTRTAARDLLARWEHDPARFALEALGVKTWTRQRDILCAIDEHPRVAVRSGHKVSKSHSAVCAALWWVCTRRGGKVVMTAPSNNQIENILWAELRAVFARAKVTLGIPPALKPITGWHLPDGRGIYGFSTDNAERMAGISGANTLFLVDEASGVPEYVFEAIEGNRAGGARIAMFGNPTQTSGTFFDAFHTKAEFWKCLHVSSEEAAAHVPHISGLALPGYIEEKRRDWGTDSPLFRVRILGEFPRQASDAVVGLEAVLAAVARHAAAVGEGPLHLGVDVARFGDDESVVALRRGKKLLELVPFQGLDGVQLAGAVLKLAREHRSYREKPIVKVDEIGVGASTVDHLRTSDEIELVPVNVSRSSTVTGDDGKPLYHLLRDQLWFATAAWLKDGGAIPDDGKLTGELVAPRYKFDLQGRLQVEPKAETKKRLKRSPDRADALALALHEEPVANMDSGLGDEFFHNVSPRRH